MLLAGVLLLLAGGTARFDLLLTAHAGAAPPELEARAISLEKKLMAPCCWQGTLEVHHSELADALHEEIRTRLARGEASTVVEQSLVSRFGMRLIAVPSPDVLEGTAGIVMLALLAVGGLVWSVARSWALASRRSASASTPGEHASPTGYDRQIDAELERLE